MRFWPEGAIWVPFGCLPDALWAAPGMLVAVQVGFKLASMFWACGSAPGVPSWGILAGRTGTSSINDPFFGFLGSKIVKNIPGKPSYF